MTQVVKESLDSSFHSLAPPQDQWLGCVGGSCGRNYWPGQEVGVSPGKTQGRGRFGSMTEAVPPQHRACQREERDRGETQGNRTLSIKSGSRRVEVRAEWGATEAEA